MTEKSKWQQEYDALPEWAQKMVRAAAFIGQHGGLRDDWLGHPLVGHYRGFGVAIANEHMDEWWEGFGGMHALADALTAPWPPPPPPTRERRALNVVEVITDDGESDCAFDQPCAFGHRVEFHAVYCHNEAWPNSPRKCRRNRTDYRHEDCPGFVANPDYQQPVTD